MPAKTKFAVQEKNEVQQVELVLHYDVLDAKADPAF